MSFCGFCEFYKFYELCGEILRFLREILQKRRIYANIVILARSVTKRRISKILINLFDSRESSAFIFSSLREVALLERLRGNPKKSRILPIPCGGGLRGWVKSRHCEARKRSESNEAIHESNANPLHHHCEEVRSTDKAIYFSES
ncbi:hypothetical protein [Helicobacter sp. 23-1045]